MKYLLEIVNSGEVMHFNQGDLPMVLIREVELSNVQVEYINKQIFEGKAVPLYSTTKSKDKYGDSRIGDIRKLTLVVKQND